MKKPIIGIAFLLITGASASAQTAPPPGYMDAQQGYPPQPPSGYAQQPPPGYPQQPPPGYAQQPPLGYAPPPVVVDQSYCQPYTDSFTLGGERRITHGTACMHPDGSWELHPLNATMNYVTRGGAVYLVPNQPFAAVVVEDGHPHYHHPHPQGSNLELNIR